MTNILPIPSKISKIQKVMLDTDVKLCELIKMKTATLKSLVGALKEKKYKD
ncbi:MAG TPA: hypothetical protein PLM55_11265 [Chitinophagales bacterium]|nr:hypothetical protein [Chitinophagales bacterium]